MSEFNEQKTLAEIIKLNEETRKLVAEAHNFEKRNQYFVATFTLAVFVAGIGMAKLFF